MSKKALVAISTAVVTGVVAVKAEQHRRRNSGVFLLGRAIRVAVRKDYVAHKKQAENFRNHQIVEEAENLCFFADLNRRDAAGELNSSLLEKTWEWASVYSYAVCKRTVELIDNLLTPPELRTKNVMSSD